MSEQHEASGANVNDEPRTVGKVLHWRCDKYEGDPPQPGEHKLPIEYVEGGDEKPTRTFRLNADGETYRQVPNFGEAGYETA